MEGPFLKNIGPPQGNVLSPTLYNLYILELSNVIHPPTQILQYAADTLLFNKEDDLLAGKQTMENNLLSINNYFKAINLSLSPEKTQFIIFSKSHTNIRYQPTLNFNDTTINPSKNLKYLGLYLDIELNWDYHYTQIIKKTSKLMNILKVLRGTWWGGHPQVLSIIYKSLIRSIIEYNLFLTHTNQCIRLVAGYRTSTALNVIHGETHIPYIQDRLNHLSNKFILKIISNNNHSLTPDIKSLNNNLNILDKHNIKSNLPILNSYNNLIKITKDLISIHNHPVPYDYEYTKLLQKPPTDLDSGLLIQKSSNAQKAFNNLFKNKMENSTVIFTDGSKIDKDQPTGLAIYFPQTQSHEMFKISKYASIFTAEALAIYLALKITLENKYTRTWIFTDSKSSLEAIQNYSPIKKLNTSPIIIDTLQIYHTLAQNNQEINLVWIPSHLGILHNEEVDNLAKRAIRIGSPLPLKLFYTDFHNHLSENHKATTNLRLLREAQFKGTLYFDNFFSPNSSKPWYAHHNHPRYHITTINRIRANHYSLAESLHRKNMKDSPSCTCGAEYEDIDHVVFSCPRFARERISLMAQLKHYSQKNKSQIPTSTLQILKHPTEPAAKFMTDFLKKCKLNI
uniref:RNase H type-1 domain-containing protein n=1 Tax=Trichogramma kaykai TaxID=54128 RepID=A0ABD2XP96_9HYME